MNNFKIGDIVTNGAILKKRRAECLNWKRCGAVKFVVVLITTIQLKNNLRHLN